MAIALQIEGNGGADVVSDGPAAIWLLKSFILSYFNFNGGDGHDHFQIGKRQQHAILELPARATGLTGPIAQRPDLLRRF